MASGKELATLSDTEWVLSVAYSSDGKSLASAGTVDTIKLWDVSKLK